ncbi:hypothetical protein IU428_12105 [Nocardia abscessus]|uniref:hypothetical protein n=1 Tax=Nocardia abscessus TaxID=120957 RepID=UPI0018932D66|nr:hypothetical protein [Nocardia abscessus]MBF6472555.1 hypothetical protein [Nocardia abscessus]
MLTLYTLRHTGISWKLQDGVPIFVVSRDAGHESVNTTDRYYGHNDRKASESAAQVIAGRLPRVRQHAQHRRLSRGHHLSAQQRISQMPYTRDRFEPSTV